MENQNGTDKAKIESKIRELRGHLTKLRASLKHKDDDFEKVVLQKLMTYNHELEQLRDRRIEGSVFEIFGYLSECITTARLLIIAVHVIRTQEDLDAWNHSTVETYYQAHVEAVRREVLVKRIFILYTNDVTGLAQGYLKNGVRELMQRQKADGIEVLVIMEDTIDQRSSIQNWIVIDDRVVEHTSSASDFGGPFWVDRRTNLTANRWDVEQYTDKFVKLEKCAKELDDWLRELDLRRITTDLPASPYVQ